MASTPQKDAIVFILDVNPSLWRTEHGNGKVTTLDKGIHAITQMIHQKIIDARKSDQLAVILYNTDETNNNLARQSVGEYQHISLVQDFESPQLGTIKYLRDKIVLGNEAKADIMDALIVGADLVMTMTAGKKTFEKKIFLFTDPNASKQINTNGLDQIISQLNDHEICLNVILLNEKEDEGSSNSSSSGNTLVLSEFCERVSDGAVYSIQDALDLLQQFMTRRVRQVATFRGSLTILPGELEVPINLFTKTSIQRLPSAKKYSPYGREGLERSLTYQQYQETLEASSNAAASSSSKSGKDELIKAYRYGRSLIPFHKIDEAQMSFKTSKSFQVLGFLPANRIDRESFMSGVYSIVGEPGNPSSLRAISAIARALYEKDMVALVRYVRAENNPPKLGILQARIKTSYESLLFNILPYSEDHRRYLFASFPVRTNPTAEQDAVMKEWINGMDLMVAARDEDGDPMEALRPGDTFNITFQAHYSAIQNRALHPEAPLLSPDAGLLTHLSTPQSLLDSTSEIFERLRQAFPLRTRTLNQQQQQQVAEQVPKLWASVTNPLTAKSFDSDDEEFAASKRTIERILNPEDPIPDFLAMLADKHQDLVESALMQLMELIPKFVQQSNIDLALKCFRELRSAALKEDEFDLFNSFLSEYKRQAALHSPALWSLLQESKITLISSTENSESPISPEEADAFIATMLP